MSIYVKRDHVLNFIEDVKNGIIRNCDMDDHLDEKETEKQIMEMDNADSQMLSNINLLKRYFKESEVIHILLMTDEGAKMEVVLDGTRVESLIML